ncbi:MAG: hypothetical protein IJY17_07275 [Alphaproteobacteria bacterium]|nr:hypothetical protein [Alphaproteobacteria bacterium]
MSWASKQWKRVKNAVSDAAHDVGKFVKTTGKNIEQTGKNLVDNPLGTVGAFMTNPLAAQAALTTKKTAAALEDYENTDFAKTVGAATVAAGAYTTGAAALGAGETVPLAAAGTVETVPLSASGTIGTGAAATAGTAEAAGGLSALETIALAEGANIGYGEYQAREAEKKSKKEAEAAAQQQAATEQAAKDDYKKAVNQNYESYRQAQTQSRYNFTTEAGAFGDYDTKPFSGLDPETGAFTRKKRYV